MGMSVSLAPANEMAAAWADSTLGLFATFHDALSKELGVSVTVTDIRLASDPHRRGAVDCLKSTPSGCSSLDNEEACTSSFDGSNVDTDHGLRVKGEPCVWCGGKACAFPKPEVCQPYDWLMFGEGEAYEFFTAKDQYTVAWCWAKWADFEIDYTTELFDRKTEMRLRGAIPNVRTSVIRNDVINAFDSDVHFISNIEVGNVQQVVRTSDVEPPSSRFMLGSLHLTLKPADDIALAWSEDIVALRSAFQKTLASELGFDVTVTDIQLEENPRAEGSKLCLTSANVGCNHLTTEDTCTTSVDGRNVEELRGLRIYHEPCVWCNGGPCVSNSNMTCAPMDWLLHGEGIEFPFFSAKNSHTVAWCWKETVALEVNFATRPTSKDQENELKSRTMLLKPDIFSTDLTRFFERSVWDNVLEVVKMRPSVQSSAILPHPALTTTTTTTTVIVGPPSFKYLAATSWVSFAPADEIATAWHDERIQLFATFHDTLSRALGVEVKVTSIRLIGDPQHGGGTDCLVSKRGGCPSVTHRWECISSKDGRDIESERGLRIRDEPCTWCDGGACTGNGPSLCEPSDWLLYGMGRVYQTSPGHTYTKAWCWSKTADFAVDYVMEPETNVQENILKDEIANMPPSLFSLEITEAFEDEVEWTAGIEVLDLKHKIWSKEDMENVIR